MSFDLKWESIRYCGYGGAPYELNLSRAPDCYVKEGPRSVATFESMSVEDKSLHIDHFAMDNSLRGSNKAGSVLRGFAQLVAEQTPEISQITFDLHRSAQGSDIEKLANARSALLERIGACDVRLRKPSEHGICVSAFWKKAQWIK